VVQVHADVGVVDGLIDLVLFFVDAQVLALVASVRFYVEQLFAVRDRRSEVGVLAFEQGRWLFPAAVHSSHSLQML
jgi:hypothetical protein